MIRLLCILTIVWGLAMSEANAKPRVITVGSTGAVADDGKDDTTAVAEAIAECIKQPGSILKFGKGQYDFFAKQPGKPGRPRRMAMVIRGAKDLVIDGGGALLMGHGVLGGMRFSNCTNIVVRNVTFDYERAPYSVGTVIAATKQTFDVEVFPEFPVVGGEEVGALMEYDPKTKWPARRCLDVYSGVKSTELLKPQVLRVHLKRPGGRPATIGRWMILRHQVYGPAAISFQGCKNVRVENVTIHTVPGMGVTGGGTTNITLKGLHVVPRPNSRRIMSATADGTHFNGCMGTITLEDCTFQGMGDDATNVHGMYHRVTEIVDERTVVTVVRNKWIKLPAKGHRLELTDPKTLLPYAMATVESAVADHKAKTHRITFVKAAPKRLVVGDVLGVIDWAPKLVIRNCKVIGSRARGFLIQTRDAIIENNVIRGNQASAINITCDYDHWTESIGTRKIIIRGNTFEDNNNGSDWHSGVISIFAHVKGKGHGAIGVHQNIIIENNTIRRSDGAAVFVGSADGVIIRNNTFEDICRAPTKTGRKSAVYLHNSRKVSVTGNKIVGKSGEGMAEGVTIGDGCEADTITVEGNKGFPEPKAKAKDADGG